MVVMKRIPLRWLTGVLILTVIFGTIYGAGQQSLRSNANDPQIQLAEDVAVQINGGGDPAKIVGRPININSSLAPFLIIYDKSGNIVASSAELNGSTPKLPKGVLDNANPRNSVTWQPADGVRIASVVNAYNNGYVLAGRNLREVEAREDEQFAIAAIGWLVSVIILTGSILFKTRLNPSGTRKKRR
jgi:hypothetical protein